MLQICVCVCEISHESYDGPLRPRCTSCQTATQTATSRRVSSSFRRWYSMAVESVKWSGYCQTIIKHGDLMEVEWGYDSKIL